MPNENKQRTLDSTDEAAFDAENPVDAAVQLTRELESPDTVKFFPFASTRELTLSREDVRSKIANPTKSGKLPSDREIQLFLKLCEFRSLNPYVGDCFLIGYDTRTGPEFHSVVSHQAMLKRADAHDKFQGFESGVIYWDTNKNEKAYVNGNVVPKSVAVIGGWCRVYRADRTEVSYRETAMSAYRKDFGHWKADPNWMITKCAEAAALRTAFPNDLEGMEIREEVDARVKFESKQSKEPTVQLGSELEEAIIKRGKEILED